jgi:hypothetical protein
MKKKLMPLAVGAAVAAATTAQAQMYINNDGTGEILVYPFYSAESGNSTNVNITNTTSAAKAVKIRIIEGENSQEVLDFNVYMSAEDHFSFAITATADGGGSLVTNDNTCTVPRLTAGEAVPFRNFLYVGDKGKDNPDTEDKDESFDNTGIARTATGYIEVIEMGQLDDTKKDWDTDDDDKTETLSPMLTAITHGADGVPADCTLPVAAWTTGGAWHAEAAAEATATTSGRGDSFFNTSWDGGGLYGEASVVNVGEAAAFGYDADAIESAVAGEGYALHYPPGDTKPDFTSPAVVETSTVEVNGTQVSMNYTTTGGAADGSLLAVTSLFQTKEVINDFVTDPGIAALTDWILTMPTKFQHIGRYAAASDGPPATPEKPTLVPFSTPWNGRTACEYATLYNWDREEANPQFVPDVPDFSPAPDVEIELYDLPLCYEVNVVQFGGESAVMNESLAVGIADQLIDVDGWAKIDLSQEALSEDGQDTVLAHKRWLGDDNNNYLQGLPVTGFAVQTYTNGNVNGSGNVANYAAAFEHRSNAVCSGSEGGCSDYDSDLYPAPAS